jgi:quercetin dioxygenase-like cupin family protein
MAQAEMSPSGGSDPPDFGTGPGDLRFPKGWFDAAHPSSRRQIFFMLEGEVEVWTSGGESRILKPGDRLLMEDTTGKGHGTRSVHGEPFGVMLAPE